MRVAMEREPVINGTACTTRRETVIPAFSVSWTGELTVTRISKFGISAVEKETGDITSSANNTMWDKNRFMKSPEHLSKYIH